MIVGDAISPFAQCRLDEALGFAIGLRPVRPSEAVLKLEFFAIALGLRFGLDERSRKLASPSAK